MPAVSLRGLIHVGVGVLNTVRDPVTKTILAFLGDTVQAAAGGAGAADGDRAEWWQHVGFASRPPKPEKGRSQTEACIVRQSDHDVCFASRDVRGQELAGELAHGETCLYAPGETGTGQARVLLKKDGSIHAYTRKGNTADGTGMTLQIDATAGAIRAINDQGFGLIIDADGVKLTAGDSSLVLNKDGSWALIGTKASTLDAAPVCIGAATNPVTDGVCCGPTGLASVAHPKLLVGMT